MPAGEPQTFYQRNAKWFLLATFIILLMVCIVVVIWQMSSESGLGGLEPNSSILIVGGIDEKGNILDTIQLYDPFDPSKNRITPPKLPFARKNAIIGVVGRKIILAGGQTSAKILKNSEIFEPEKGNWIAGPNLDTAHGRTKAAGAVVGTRFYMCGGKNVAGHVVSDCGYFDLNKNSFVSGSGGMPPAVQSSYPISAVSAPPFLYVIGYAPGQAQPLLERLDNSQLGAWTLLSTEIPGWVPSWINARWLAMGILGENLIVCENHCVRFDLKEHFWVSDVPAMHEMRKGYKLVTLGNRLYSVGGTVAPSGKSTKIVESWALGEKDWKDEHSLFYANAEGAVVVY